MGCLRRRRQSFLPSRFPARAGKVRLGHLGQRLGRPPFCRGRSGRPGPRLRASLCEKPFLWRVCVRLGMGQRLAEGRPALLPEAAMRHSLHSGHRPAPSGPAGVTRPGAGRGSGRRPWSKWRKTPGSPPFTSPSPPKSRPEPWRRAAGCSAWASSTIGPITAMPTSTISWRRCRHASARPSARNASGPTVSTCGYTPSVGAISRPRIGTPSTGSISATVEKKWAHAYLTRDFFACLASTMADRVVLVMAEQDGHWVAGALNLVGKDALYGRNWGAVGDFRFLHFEMCYYRAIDFAIERAPRPCRSRSAGRTQGQPRLSAGADVERPLDPRPRVAPRRRRFPRRRTAGGGRRHPGHRPKAGPVSL